MLMSTTNTTVRLGIRGIIPIIAFASSLTLGSNSSWAIFQDSNGCGTFGTTTGADTVAFSQAELRSAEELQEKAKQALNVPTFVGTDISYFHLEDDGSKLNVTTTQIFDNDDSNGCGAPQETTLFNSLRGPSSETDGYVVRGLLERDLTQAMGLSAEQFFLLGFGAGYFHTETDSNLTSINGRDVAFSDSEEDGAQLDLYFLYASGSFYTIGSVSGRFGDGDVDTNTDKTSYDVYSYTASLNVGQNRKVGNIRGNNVYFDLSTGFAYNKRIADSYILDGVDVRDRDFSTLFGNVTGTLAIDIPGVINWRPFIRGSIKHRFHERNEFTIADDAAGITERVSVDADDTFYRIGGGITGKSNDGKTTLQLRGYYEGSGQTDEVGGTANVIIKLN